MRRDRLEADIDTRLLGVWGVLWGNRSTLRDLTEQDEEARALFAALLRTAYGEGYTDALTEDTNGLRGQLAREHGYRTP